jgi:hypothetical protein
MIVDTSALGRHLEAGAGVGQHRGMPEAGEHARSSASTYVELSIVLDIRVGQTE